MVVDLALAFACCPFIYYLISLYSAYSFFKTKQTRNQPGFTPPVSLLKPVRGRDGDETYRNFASFCEQDYPEYEILFCVDDGDEAIPILERLVKDFPDRNIRVLLGSGRDWVNDKVARLDRLTHEARFDLFVITDADVRVRPDYLRSVVAPFRDKSLGAATCLYASASDHTFLERLQSVSMISDFFAGVIVAWKLDGVRFALGQTIVTTRANVAGFGGYAAIQDRPADDLYIGRFAVEQGLATALLPYVVETVPDFGSFDSLFRKRVRWMTVMRHMRPFGHLGLIFTWGLPWSILAVLLHPTAIVAGAYLGAYVLLRTTMTWLIGIWGMKQHELWVKMPLIPLWDLMAFCVWIASFCQTTIRWRGVDYTLSEGKLRLWRP